MVSMRNMTAVVIAAFLGLSGQARAEGALAVGCTSDGTIVWGWQFGESSVETAESKALQSCQAKGSDCTLFRAALHGDGAWIALATDPTAPAPQCLPAGEYYSASKETFSKTKDRRSTLSFQGPAPQAGTKGSHLSRRRAAATSRSWKGTEAAASGEGCGGASCAATTNWQ